MASIIVGKQNTLAYTLTVAAGTATIVISGESDWDLGLTDIQRIVNTTHAATFGLTPGTTFSNTFVAGLPTYTWVIPNVPSGTVTNDVLLIYLNATYPQIDISLLQYQKA